MPVVAEVSNFDEDKLEKEKPVIGLEDGGHVIIKCSNCDRGLLDIFITQPRAIDPATNKPFVWNMKAKCCFCGDHSYVKEIKGKFHLSGYGQIKEDDESQDIPETFIGSIDEQGDVIIVETIKA